MSAVNQPIFFSVTNDLNYDQRMIRICSSLQKAGYAPLLIGRNKKDSPSLADRKFAQHRLSCVFQRGKLFYLEYNLRLFFYLLLKKAPAAYAAVDLDSIGPMALVAKLKRRPLIFDAHEYFWETPEVSRRPMIQKIWKAWANIWVPQAVLAYTVAPQLAKLFESIHKIPFATIRNVSFSQPFIEPTTTDHFVILYQGMLNEGRGLEALIEAMPAIKGAELWLAGDGDIADDLREQVQRLSLSPRVKFLGMLKPEELPGLTAKANLGINLLEERSKSYYYSLANKCFDYIAAGLPAMHMNFPEYQALQEQYAGFLLVDNLDSAELAQAIQVLIDDPNKLLELQHNNRLAAKDLTWENEEKKLIGLYDSILRKG